MGVSAYQLGLEKGERFEAGQLIDPSGSYWWDDATKQWRPFNAYVLANVAPKSPPPSSPPAGRTGAPSVSPLVPLAVVGVLGAGAWWWWRR